MQALADPDAGYPRRVVCRTQVISKPEILPAARTYADLDAAPHPWLRRLSLLAQRVMVGVRRLVGLLDRTNSTRIEDCIEVRTCCRVVEILVWLLQGVSGLSQERFCRLGDAIDSMG